MPSVTSVSAKRALLGGVDEIRCRRDLAAAAIGGAIDGGDHRDRTGQDRPQHALEHEMLGLPGFVGHAVALLEIAAGAERFGPRAGQDGDAQPLEVDRKPLEQFHEVEPHLRIQGIRRIRPVQRDQQDMVVTPLHRDRLELASHRPGSVNVGDGIASPASRIIRLAPVASVQ